MRARCVGVIRPKPTDGIPDEKAESVAGINMAAIIPPFI
jgi:hypothetical protein